MSRKQLAKVLGVGGKTVDSWESGSNLPQQISLRRLQEWIGDDVGSPTDSLLSVIRWTEDGSMGRRMAERRREWGLSARQLGALLEISPGAIRAWERGKGAPNEDSQRKLANWFDEAPPTYSVAFSEIDAERIIFERTRRGFTRPQLANRLGMTTKTILEWERRGKYPTRASLRKLAAWISEEDTVPPSATFVSVSEWCADGSIGRRIKERRLEWRLTFPELAEQLGVSIAAIKGWVREKWVPGGKARYKLSEWFSQDPPTGSVEFDELDRLRMELDGVRVKLERTRRGMSIPQLALRLGVSTKSIEDWEGGYSHPNDVSLRKLSDWIGEDDVFSNSLILVSEWCEDGSIGRRLEQWRSEWGLTQSQLAEQLTVSSVSVSNWETGKWVPRGSSRQKLADFFSEATPPHSDVLEAIDGDRIRFERERRLMTISQLADRLGITRKALSEWERGLTPPRRASLRKLAAWLEEDDIISLSATSDSVAEWCADGSIGRRIDERRVEWRLSYPELAERLKVPYRALRDWVLGVNVPRAGSKLKLVKWFAEDPPTSSVGFEEIDSERIRFERTRRGMSVIQLAHRLGVDRQTIYDWENGRKPPSDVSLRKLSDWVGGVDVVSDKVPSESV